MDLKREGNAFRKYDGEGKMIAEVLFPENNGSYEITRTFVDESLRGQKMAAKLVERVIEQAKEDNKKITPSCSYAVHYFEKNDEYSDLVAK